MTICRLYSIVLVFVGLWFPGFLSAQTAVSWPPDVHASCEETLEDVFATPVVSLDAGCPAMSIDFVDVILEVECPQNMVVDRTWTVTACDSVFVHVQRIELLDTEAPYVLNPHASEHFFSNELDWLPLVRDKCDFSLGGGITFSDTTNLCCGVTSFIVNLNVPDDCGNVLDTAYRIYLHDIEPYLVCDEMTPNPCGEGTMMDATTGTCIPSELCVAGPEACGPNTVWNNDLGLCVPETLLAQCYFDTNGDGTVGTPDLLSFLSAYGQTCDVNLLGED